MNARLNELHDALASLQLRQIEATQKGEHALVAVIDRLVALVLDEIERVR